MNKKAIIVIVFLSIFFSGCKTTKSVPSATSTITSTPGPLPSATSTPMLMSSSPTPEEVIALPHYDIKAIYDYAQQAVSVQQSIVFSNPSETVIDKVDFDIESNLFADCFHLENVTDLDGNQLVIESLQLNRLVIQLSEPVEPRKNIGVMFSYSLRLPFSSDYTSRPIPFGYTNRQTNLVDWYPTLPPYIEGSGWAVNQPGYYGEHTVYLLADFDISLSIINAPAGVTVAASSIPIIDGNTYAYTHYDARNFAWSASTMYEVSETVVGDTIIRAYSFPFNPTANQQALNDTAKALSLGNQLFTTYPRKLLSVVEADFLDGMEYDGLFFLSRGFYNSDVIPPRAYITIISAHETAHQWFYASLGNDQSKEPWLDESLCTYFERLFYEKYYPDDLEWWWSTRINYFSPSGYINQSLYEYPDYTSYRNAVYLNGAIFLEKLRENLGDEYFYQFLKQYTVQYNHHFVTSNSFLDLLSDYTDKDLSPLINMFVQ